MYKQRIVEELKKKGWKEQIINEYNGPDPIKGYYVNLFEKQYTYKDQKVIWEKTSSTSVMYYTDKDNRLQDIYKVKDIKNKLGFDPNIIIVEDLFILHP